MTSPLNLQRAAEFVTALVFDNNADSQTTALDGEEKAPGVEPCLGEPEVLLRTQPGGSGPHM